MDLTDPPPKSKNDSIILKSLTEPPATIFEFEQEQNR